MGEHVCAIPKRTMSSAATERCQPRDHPNSYARSAVAISHRVAGLLLAFRIETRRKGRSRDREQLNDSGCPLCCVVVRGGCLALGLSSLANLGEAAANTLANPSNNSG